MRDGSVGAGSTIRPSNARPRCRSSAVTDRSGCSSTSPRSSTNTWWSGVSVRPSEPKSGFVSTATMRSRRTRASSEPEQHGQRGLAHAALGRHDRDRRAAGQPRRGDRAVEPRLVLASRASSPSRARSPSGARAREQLALALRRRLGRLDDRRLGLVAEERLDRERSAARPGRAPRAARPACARAACRAWVSGRRSTSAGFGGAIAASAARSASARRRRRRRTGRACGPAAAAGGRAAPRSTRACGRCRAAPRPCSSSTNVGISSEIGVSVETTRSTRRSGPAIVTAQVFMSGASARSDVHGAEAAARPGVGGEKAVWIRTGRSPRRTSSPRPGGCGWALAPPSSGPSPGSPLSRTPGEPSSRRRPKTAS